MSRYESIPQELKEMDIWCVWKYEQRENGKPTKVPYNPMTGRKARSNVPADFCDFAAAVNASGKYDGIGAGVFGDVAFIDIDHCVENGMPNAFATAIIAEMDSPAEISPSGTGIRIACRAKNFEFGKTRYYINNAKLGLEIYVGGATKKFVTFTGNSVHSAAFGERGERLKAVLEQHMLRPVAIKTLPVSGGASYLSDSSVFEKAVKSKNGEAFERLWNGDISGFGSQSEADMSLASFLAFFCNRDIEQMDRIFRMSGLMRNKWDRPQSGSSYGRLTLKKAAATVGQTYKPGFYRTSAAEDFAEEFGLEDLKPETNPRYEWNDIGAGNLFADVCKPVLRYVPERKCWYWYDGSRWKQDVGGLGAMEMCKRLFERLMVYAFTIKDERRRELYVKYVAKWSGRGSRSTIIADAQSVYPISMSEFDKNPLVFNCANVTLFLTDSGVEAREHCAEDLLTKISPVVYDFNARNRRWLRFIDEIMDSDKDKACFLQKSRGYGFSGDTSLECMFFDYGATTRNGKGTLNESILQVMGDYGCTSRPEMLSMKTSVNSQAPTEDVARLNGIHFNNISEPGKGLVLNAALVKTLTGNDTLNARFLHENSFDFRPQFKIYINTNYLPAINDMTLFSSGRVYIIPFERHFGEDEQDKTLKREFAKPEVQSAILNWLIDGWILLKSEGIEPPESVRTATESYRRESDKIGLFIEECLEPKQDAEERTSVIYSRYRGWCAENGYFTENTRNFRQALQSELRIERRRPRSGGGMTTLVVGHRLISEFLNE